MKRIKEVYKGSSAILNYGIDPIFEEEKAQEKLKYSLGTFIKLPEKEKKTMTKTPAKRNYKTMTKEQKALCIKHLNNEITFQELKEQTGLGVKKLEKKMYDLRAKHQKVKTGSLYYDISTLSEKDSPQEKQEAPLKINNDKTSVERLAIIIDDVIDCIFDSNKILEANAVKNYIINKNSECNVKLYILTEL